MLSSGRKSARAIKENTMNKMIETIEILNQNCVCLIKIGKFYHTYGKDSYILSFLFNYKVDLEKHECGFPTVSLNKVLSRLENEKINYLVIDKRNEYDVDSKQDFKNLNKYQKIYLKSRNFVNYKVRIKKIEKDLLEQINEKDFRKTLGEIEKIIDERRKV